MRRSITASLMRSINRSAILGLVRERGPISRSQISRELNMSLPTVMRIADDLMADQIIKEAGFDGSTGGRPSSLLEFNGQGFAVLGIDLGGTKMYGTVADLAGNIQHRLYVAHQDSLASSNGNYLDGLIEFIQQLLDAPRPAGQRIRGIGVGAPGITIVPEGIVSWSPALGWRDLPLQDLLMDAFDLPVTVENDVNLAALGEWGFGAGRGVQSLVAIAVGTGIGAGILIDGAIYRGYNLAAGEIGYMLPSVQYLDNHYEDFGALEALASGAGVADRGREALAAAGLPLPPEGLNGQYVFTEARRGVTWAQQVIQETVDYLSLAIANISAVLNPELVVLGGGVANSGDMLIDPIIQRIEGTIPNLPRITVSELGRDAAVMGAIMHVMNATDEYFVIKQLG